jgi:NTP pyrophosphatase (non-canonical NTP hydrolase)
VTINLNEYQKAAHLTAVYPNQDTLQSLYGVALGLSGEAGEVAGKLFKVFRGDRALSEEARVALIAELGDVLWFVAEMSTLLDVRLSAVASANLDKLRDRQQRSVLKGDGDAR